MELIDWKELKRLGFPYSRAHTQRLENQCLFPKRRRLNPGVGSASRVAWVKQEYMDWVATASRSSSVTCLRVAEALWDQSLSNAVQAV